LANVANRARLRSACAPRGGPGQDPAQVEKPEAPSKSDKELLATLTDIRAMAHLGRYYADKIRGAAQVAVFSADSSRDEYPSN
jgi:hypothetical protein